MVAGVCGGLGRYFDVNPTFYRVGFVVLALLGGAGILIYVAALLVMPERGRGRVDRRAAFRTSRPPRPARGIGIVPSPRSPPLARADLADGDIAWVLLLLAGVALLAARRGTEPGRRDRAAGAGGPARPRPGLAVAAPLVPAVPGRARRARRRGRNAAALSSWGVDIPWSAALAIAAGPSASRSSAVPSCTCASVAGRDRRSSSALAAILASIFDVQLNDGVGDRSYHPRPSPASTTNYRLGVGDARRSTWATLALPAGESASIADVGIGELRVIVPRDVRPRRGHVDWGDSEVFDEDDNGHDVDHDHDRPVGEGAPCWSIDAHVGAGKVEVQTAP